MSLDVDAPFGLGQSEEHAIHIAWETLDEVMTELTKAGFPPIDKPAYQLQMIRPIDHQNMTSQQFAVWNQMYESWQSYTSQQMNFGASKRLEITNEMKRLAASIRSRLRKEKPKPSEDAINDAVIVDPRYGELTRLEQQWKQWELGLEPQYEHIKATLRHLSRGLASKQLEADLTHGRRGYGQSG